MNRQEQERMHIRVMELERELKELRALVEDLLGKFKAPLVYPKRDVSRRARL